MSMQEDKMVTLASDKTSHLQGLLALMQLLAAPHVQKTHWQQLISLLKLNDAADEDLWCLDMLVQADILWQLPQVKQILAA